MVLDLRSKEGQYHVDAGGAHEDDWPDPVAATTTGEDNWFAVICGTGWGPVTVRVQLLNQRPETAPSTADPWEMVVERDIVAGGPHMQLIEIMTPQPFHTIEAGPGRFRARIHTAHRAQAFQAGDLSEPVEHHWLQFWPADAPAEPSVLKGPDTFAQNY
ncbi:hypothetical protein [Amycolatopsis sp. NPDC051903]|uniref:hypothetical protein n=1 Tax=Amycolatopsis sp. NPDC051903 TaxID=3363936 RepID=UPI0037B9B3E0